MDTAIIVQILYGVIGGIVGQLVFHGLLSLKLFRLQMAVGALQQTMLSLRNTEKANKRWAKEDQLTAELEMFKKEPSSNGTGYANDPLKWG